MAGARHALGGGACAHGARGRGRGCERRAGGVPDHRARRAAGQSAAPRTGAAAARWRADFHHPVGDRAGRGAAVSHALGRRGGGDMSYGVAAALQQAVFERLRGDAALEALVGDAIYDAVPNGAVPPLYVTLGPEDARARDDATVAGAWHRLTVT